MEERNLEATICTSCGEQVLTTEKFCKNCGKPLGQKNENNVAKENPNKKFVLTFEALGKSFKNDKGQDIGITYLIEVDGNFIGKINSGERIDTFVTKGKHNILLKYKWGFIPNEAQISVADNQTILLYGRFFSPALLTNPSDKEKEEILQRDKKAEKMSSKVLWVFGAVFAILGIVNLIGTL